MPRDTLRPVPFAPSWRVIVGPAMVLPSLLILAWSLPMLSRHKADELLPGASQTDRQRLQKVLHEPPKRPVPLRDDVIRVASPTEAAINRGEDSAEAAKPDGTPVINRSLLGTIQDNNFGVPAAERSAYERCLELTRSATAADWERKAHADVSLGLLLLEPDRWRGELVTIEGEMRRLNRLDKTADGDSAAATWEAWLFTADSGVNPFRVILTSCPDDLPQGDAIPPRRVRVTGLFYKRFSYATARGFHTAPMLIAPTVVPVSRAPMAGQALPNRSRTLTVVAVGVLLLFFGIIAAGQFAARRSHLAARVAACELRDGATPDFQFLNDTATGPPAEA